VKLLTRHQRKTSIESGSILNLKNADGSILWLVGNLIVIGFEEGPLLCFMRNRQINYLLLEYF